MVQPDTEGAAGWESSRRSPVEGAVPSNGEIEGQRGVGGATEVRDATADST